MKTQTSPLDHRHPLASSPLPADQRHFRACLGSFATGVTIVTTRAADGAPVGLTANSFNSLSLEPPLVLWSLGSGSRSLQAFEAAEHFAVSVLASDQYELAKRFAGDPARRFAGVGVTEAGTGSPLIDGALGWFECRTVSRHRHGDHVLFVGEVIRCANVPGEPLVFERGEFRASHHAQDGPLA